MKYIDVLGGPDIHEHFPTGWTAAFSTLFQMFKHHAEYSDGTSDPLVVSWPKGIKARSEIRNQSPTRLTSADDSSMRPTTVHRTNPLAPSASGAASQRHGRRLPEELPVSLGEAA